MSTDVSRRRRGGSLYDDGRFSGAHFANRAVATPERLSWYQPQLRGAQTPWTTLRPLPTWPVGVAPGDPSQLAPWRDNDQPGSVGEWIIAVRVVKGFGGLCFLAEDPFADSGAWRNSPAALLFFGLKQAKTDKAPAARFATLLDNQPGRGAVIPPVKRAYLVQALVFEHNGKVLSPAAGLRPEEPQPRLVLLSADVVQKRLLKDLEERRDPHGSGLENFRYHDPVALDAGQFLRFFPAKCPPPNMPPGHLAKLTADNAASQDSFEGYGMYMSRKSTALGRTAALSPEEQRHVLQYLRPWEEAITVLSFEEQARLIVNSQTVDYEVLEYCWADHPEWLAGAAAGGPQTQRPVYGGTPSTRAASASAFTPAAHTGFDDEDELPTVTAPAATAAAYDDDEEAAMPGAAPVDDDDFVPSGVGPGAAAQDDDDELAPGNAAAMLDDDDDEAPAQATPAPASRAGRRQSTAAGAATAAAPRPARRRAPAAAADEAGIFDARPAAAAAAAGVKQQLAAARERLSGRR